MSRSSDEGTEGIVNGAAPSAEPIAHGRIDSAARRQVGSAARGQVEPIAALVALLAVGVGLSLYAGAIASVDATTESRETADVVLDRVHDEITVAGVSHPDRLAVPADIPISDRRVGVGLFTREGRWLAGKRNASRPYPPDVTVVERTVSVRIAPGEQVRGELRAVVAER